MSKKDFSTKKFVEKPVGERNPANPPASAEEGARLIRAFVAVKSPQLRKAIVAFVENLV